MVYFIFTFLMTHNFFTFPGCPTVQGKHICHPDPKRLPISGKKLNIFYKYSGNRNADCPKSGFIWILSKQSLSIQMVGPHENWILLRPDRFGPQISLKSGNIAIICCVIESFWLTILFFLWVGLQARLFLMEFFLFCFASSRASSPSRTFPWYLCS